MNVTNEKILKTGKAMLAFQGRILRDVLVPTLKQMGATNILFGTGIEILRQVQDFEPDLIYCEYAMDLVNGEAFAQQLRRGFRMTTPLVMLIPRYDDAALTKSKAAGATATLEIPFAVGDIIKVSKKVMVSGGAPKKLYFGD